ncbi:beta-propeller fold lactonase family protein [Bacillus pfraonensis]|nr:beta-propeller fold lactonase family protein [Bacillus pseudomycoides]
MMNNKELIGYIGTYTRGDSKGIYTFTLETEMKKISNVRPVANLDNPTYLTINQSNQYLYSVIKEGEAGEKN